MIKVLGFDYGRKRIGVASGQTITGTAEPLTTIQSTDGHPDWEEIDEVISEYKPDALIVGIPHHTDGTRSEMSDECEDFGRSLESKFNLPIHYIDESLSSHEAESILKTRTKISQQNKHEVDKIAAALIVQNWLDQH